MLASPWRRVAATSIDVILVLVVFGSLFNFNVSSQFFATQRVYQLVHPANAIINLAALIIYFTALEGTFGATFGKWILRERVVDLHAKKIGLARAFARNVVKPLDIFTIGLALLLLSPRNQTIGDRLARTAVVRSGFLAASEVGACAVTPLRMGVALLVLAFNLWAMTQNAVGWVNVYRVTQVARTSIGLMKEGYRLHTMRALYSSGSDELHQHRTLAQFQANFLNLAAELAFTSLGPVRFSRWTFQGRLAAAEGSDDAGNDCTVVVIHDARGWKFQAMRLGSQDDP